MKISKGTIIRTAILVIAIINNALALAGKSPLPIDDEMVTETVSFGATAITAMIAWWKNNSFTSNAIKADELLKEMKTTEKGE